MNRSVVRRARPLLGTFVEVEAHAANGPAARRASDAAFDAVGRIDRLMSFHRADSDLSRLNGSASGEWVEVDPDTVRVLALSNELFKVSGGIFDIRCGHALVEWGYLPPASSFHATQAKQDLAPVEIEGRRIRKTGRWTLDLGGIAKGYAVDAAVAAMRAAGARAGLVNAGGDLRAFGRREWEVFVRHPAMPGAAHGSIRLRTAAMATSAIYFSRRKVGRRNVSPIVQPHTGAPFTDRRSVSVLADTCVLADALTKVAALAPRTASFLLDRYRSKGLVVATNGTVGFLN